MTQRRPQQTSVFASALPCRIGPCGSPAGPAGLWAAPGLARRKRGPSLSVAEGPRNTSQLAKRLRCQACYILWGEDAAASGPARRGARHRRAIDHEPAAASRRASARAVLGSLLGMIFSL